mgnify:CR=1 FL=1
MHPPEHEVARVGELLDSLPEDETLGDVARAFGHYPLVLEVRHATWNSPELFRALVEPALIKRWFGWAAGAAGCLVPFAPCDLGVNLNFAPVLDLVARYDEALGALGRAADIEVRTRPHEALARAVAPLGAVVKPSGAGGGDVSLIFSAGPIDPHRLREVLPSPARALDLDLGAPGLNSFF